MHLDGEVLSIGHFQARQFLAIESLHRTIKVVVVHHSKAIVHIEEEVYKTTTILRKRFITHGVQIIVIHLEAHAIDARLHIFGKGKLRRLERHATISKSLSNTVFTIFVRIAHHLFRLELTILVKIHIEERVHP